MARSVDGTRTFRICLFRLRGGPRGSLQATEDKGVLSSVELSCNCIESETGIGARPEVGGMDERKQGASTR